MCITEYYSATRSDKILPFGPTWMNLEDIMLSEISQTVKYKCYMISHICGILKGQTCRNRTEKCLLGSWRMGEMGEVLVKEYKLPVRK